MYRISQGALSYLVIVKNNLLQIPEISKALRLAPSAENCVVSTPAEMQYFDVGTGTAKHFRIQIRLPPVQHINAEPRQTSFDDIVIVRIDEVVDHEIDYVLHLLILQPTEKAEKVLTSRGLAIK